MNVKAGDKVRVVFKDSADDVCNRLGIDFESYEAYQNQVVEVRKLDLNDENCTVFLQHPKRYVRRIWVSMSDIQPVDNHQLAEPTPNNKLRPLGFQVGSLKIEVEYDGDGDDNYVVTQDGEAVVSFPAENVDAVIEALTTLRGYLPKL